MNFVNIFPANLLRTELPDHQRHNRAIVEHILERERTEPNRSMNTTVHNGWQSGVDILDTSVPSLRALKEFLDESVEAYVERLRAAEFAGLLPASLRWRYNAWAVILRQSALQHEHAHTDADLVGVYYASATDAGDLVLSYPRSGGTSVWSIWERARVRITPAPGMFLLFPGFVPHRVECVEGAGERITISIDVSLRP